MRNIWTIMRKEFARILKDPKSIIILLLPGIMLYAIYSIVEHSSADQTAMNQYRSLVPLFIIIFLFVGCLVLAPDSIAGEKERGTIATLLITPIRRGQLALGKIFSLSTMACISAISSFLGLLFSLNLFGSGLSEHGFTLFLLILVVIITTVLLIMSVMCVISAFARGVREASMFILPFMLLSVVVCFATMTAGASPRLGLYFIPIYNSVKSITSIIDPDSPILSLNLCITFISNIAYMAGCVFVLRVLFKSEKVMFSK